MALYEFEGKRPTIGKTSFVPDSADIIGDVVIGEECFIGVGRASAATTAKSASATGLRCKRTSSSTRARATKLS